MSVILSYKDLVVWQRSMRLVTDIYRLSNTLPPEEKYGLVSQIRRCAVSIPSNIAEGYHRGTRKDYRRCIKIAFGSCAELETQVLLIQQLDLANHIQLQPILDEIATLMKMLNVLAQRLE